MPFCLSYGPSLDDEPVVGSRRGGVGRLGDGIPTPNDGVPGDLRGLILMPSLTRIILPQIHELLRDY